MNLPKTSVEYFRIIRSSKLFQPINIIPKQNDRNIKPTNMSKSQKLLLDLGIIRHSSNGIYHLLPLGVRCIHKLKLLVRKNLTEIEAQEIKMPFIVDGSLWKQSGRWETTEEIFKFKDKHESDFILSPTNEESVTELVTSLGQLSHRQLPFILYQIASKFRDEIKPRCGLIRTKEFQMMDAYSFDCSIELARDSYEKMCKIFENIFNFLELPFVKVLADPGIMGGDISHEYHFVSFIGEDFINICQKCGQGCNVEHISNSCPSCGGDSSLKQFTGIEVGHTFLLGTRYTLPLECVFKDKDGSIKPLIMGSYGLGLTRMLASSLELLSSDEEIVWPPNIAPFTVCVIPPKEGSKEWEIGNSLSLDLYKELDKIFPEDVLLDDKVEQTIGKRLRQARKTGYPFIVCIGKRAMETPPLYELFCAPNNTTHYLTLSELLKYLVDFHQNVFVTRTVF